jgi:hypothetical protein
LNRIDRECAPLPDRCCYVLLRFRVRRAAIVIAYYAEKTPRRSAAKWHARQDSNL